jgi:hypothetical protein
MAATADASSSWLHAADRRCHDHCRDDTLPFLSQRACQHQGHGRGGDGDGGGQQPGSWAIGDRPRHLQRRHADVVHGNDAHANDRAAADEMFSGRLTGEAYLESERRRDHHHGK